MNGVIEKIIIYREKGAPGVELAEGRLIEDRGLEGDFHATGGGRQVSLLFTGIRESLKGAKEQGLCFSRFKENITIKGPGCVKTGDHLAAGESLLEITGETKRCHEECTLYNAGKRCPLSGASLFAKVLKGGVIHSGDRIDKR